MNNKKALVFKKLDSIMYSVKDLHEGIKFFEQFGLKSDQIKEDVGWCNLHMKNNDLCIDLSTKIEVGNFGEPYYLVGNVRDFYKACLDAGIKVIKEPFEVMCGDCVIIEGPSSIKLAVLDLTKQNPQKTRF